jgi:hypothetical protein
MPIDIKTEQIFLLSDGPDYMPHQRRGRKFDRCTFFRWAKSGRRGVVLETLQTPSGKITSVEALQRFFEALSDPCPVYREPMAVRRAKSNAKTAEILKDAGI